jgi:hypothetical protein
VKRAMIIIGMMITNVINIQSGEDVKNIITRYQYLEKHKAIAALFNLDSKDGD